MTATSSDTSSTAAVWNLEQMDWHRRTGRTIGVVKSGLFHNDMGFNVALNGLVFEVHESTTDALYNAERGV